MPDTLTDAHLDWAQNFTGVALVPDGSTADPADPPVVAAQPDPNAGQPPAPPADPPPVDPPAVAAQPDPNAGQPPAPPADPPVVAAQPDPNAGQPPAAPADPPVVAAQPDPNAGQPPAPPADPPVVAAQPDPNAGQPPAPPSDPPVVAAQPDPNAGQPPAAPADPPVVAAQPDPNAGQPPGPPADPPVVAAQPDPNAGQPPAPPADPPVVAAQPDPNAGQAPAAPADPPVVAAQPDPNAGQPPAAPADPPVVATQPDPNTGQPPAAPSDPPPADPPVVAAQPDPNAGQPPADPADLSKQCDDYLHAHRFSAELAEVVPGDHQCNVFLDDRLVKKQDVFDALSTAFPALASDQTALWAYVNDAWDTELKTAFVGAGVVPVQSSMTRPRPDGLLARSIDQQVFWQPAPIQTIGTGDLQPVADNWLKDFLDFYEISPGDPADTGGGCVFNGSPDTVANVVKVMGEQAELAGYKANPGSAQSLAQAVIDARARAAKQGGQVADRAATYSPDGPPSNEGTQIVNSAGVQAGLHWELTPSPNPPKPADPASDTVVQYQFGVNYVDHPKDQTGNEFAGQLTLGYNVLTQDWQTLAGGQFVSVVAVWKAIQVQYFFNAGAGVSKNLANRTPAHGVLQWQTGAQVVVSVGPVQFGIAVGGGATVNQGGPTTADTTVQGQITVPLDTTDPTKGVKPELDIHELTAMKMSDMLDALDEIDTKGQLDKIPNPDPRVAAGIMTIHHDFGVEAKQKAYYAFVDTLRDEADKDAIRQYINRHIGSVARNGP